MKALKKTLAHDVMLTLNVSTARKLDRIFRAGGETSPTLTRSHPAYVQSGLTNLAPSSISIFLHSNVSHPTSQRD